MKKISKVILLAALCSLAIPSWAQSTQGKEFWVSSSIVCSPAKNQGIEPYIAISAEKACTVNIQGGVGNAINITQQVAAGSWNEFGHNSKAEQRNPNQGLVYVNMDASKWYPIDTKEPATVCNLAGQKNMYGLHITATEMISIYVILGGDNAMDASNILPLSALGSEYYVQDYIPEAHNGDSWSTNEGNMVTVTTILGTEDGTKVDITPKGSTYDNHSDGTTYTIDLNKGQTYYLISQKEQQLAGTHIVAKNGRKIAIYTGSPLTRLPNGISARDALFEQPMPVEYWGTQFIVTRSLGKNGNIIGITASQNGTEIKLDGYSQNPGIFINEGETYYLALQNAGNPQTNKPGDSPVPAQKTVTGDALFIETSCPCAVYSYDTGNGYKGRNDADDEVEEDGKPLGDPSSVWVAPIQQKIGQITFGTCYTDMTENHFLNIVTESATCQNTKLTALYGATQLDKTNLLTWIPVPGNPTYSYARAKIGDKTTKQFSVFRLENSKGFIATVYGNGKNESYAYSAGSAAVEQGVNVEGETFTDGYRSNTKFCIDTELSFDAKVGTDEITRVDWNFGDGTTQYNGEPVTTHTYNTPGWYDATAKLYGRQACADVSEQDLGTVSFTFRVWRHDTVIVAPTKKCLTPEEQADTIREKGQEYLDYLLANPSKAILNPDAPCYENRQLSVVTYGLETTLEKEEEGRDSVYVNEQWYYADKDPRLPADGIIEWIEEKANRYNCDRHVTCHAKIITCLDIDIQQTQLHTCLGENLLVNYTKYKGDIDGKAVLTIVELPSYRKEIDIPQANISGTIDLPIADLKDPGYYTGIITIHDVNCSDQTLEFTIPIVVYYPADIFVQKFNNVLAVYAPGNGGNKGYTFTGYQWYRNGEAIQDATGAVYHSENPLEGIYYVVLTNSQNVTLPSCEQEVYGKSYMPSQAPAAQKKIVNQRICIVIDNRAYDVYGQRVE